MSKKQDLIRQAEECEAQEQEAEGSWAEYLHAKAQGLREMAANAKEDSPDARA